MELYNFNAVIQRVIDGDTVEAVIDVGFDILHRTNIRFIDIDTPETRRVRNVSEAHVKRGKDITQWLKDKIEGMPVTIKTRKMSGDITFNRYLAYIYIDDNGESIDLIEMMLSLGFNKTEQEKAEME